MNTKNNKRRRESVKKIENAFTECLQNTDINKISVSDICKKTGLNRSTFYANFTDIYDLANKTMEKLENDFNALFPEYGTFSGHSGAIKMFTHIKENQLLYKTYFKLRYDSRHQTLSHQKELALSYFDSKYINYHIEFFKNGLNAIIKLWLDNGCAESPEEMAEIIRQEYSGRIRMKGEREDGIC